MKLRSALLLVVAATVCALGGLLSPQVASASVDAVTQWPVMPPIVSNSSAGNLSGKLTVGAGNNRVLLVAIATEYTSGNPAIAVGAVTYGGTALTNIAAATNTTGLNKIWVGYLALGTATVPSTATLAVNNTGTAGLTATYVTAAVYNGVDQASPITGSGSASGSTATLTTSNFAVTGINGNNGLAVFISNYNGATLNTTGTATKVREYAGASFNLGAGQESVVTNAADNQTVTASAAVAGVLAGVGLNPATRIATNSTCGDCHGYPPQDGSARNVPSGQFTGSHDKHTGNNANQYNYACTQCHYNNTTNYHSTGYRNITGSSVPGNAYSRTKKVLSDNVNGTGTCSNITCHSTGRTVRQYATSPAWGTAGTCLSCHAGRSTAGQNPPAHSANNFTLSTTHSQHLKYLTTEINCNMCHGKTAASHSALKDYTGAQYHGNGSKNILFTNIAYGSMTSYKSPLSGSTGTSKTCNNTACHGGQSRSAWQDTAAINSDHTCAHCHGTAGTTTAAGNADRRLFAPGFRKSGTSTDQTKSSANLRVGAHFKHLSSAYTRNLKCNECHLVPAKPFDTATNHTLNNLRFNSGTLTFNQASTATVVIGVAAGSNPARNNAVTYVNGTGSAAAQCNTTYCHGNRLKTGDTSGSLRAPFWNVSTMINYTDPAVACGRCHGVPPTTGTSSTTHSGKTLTGVNACSNCHAMVVDSNGKIINKDLHINGQVNASGGHEYGFAGNKHMPGGTGSITVTSISDFSKCTGCHSVTSGGTYPVSARGVAGNLVCTVCHKNNPNFFTTGSLGTCGDCHGTNANNNTGRPDGNVFPNWSGSHTKHVVGQGLACSDCHSNGGTGSAKHGSYSGVAHNNASYVNVTSTMISGKIFSYRYNGGTKTCSSVTCHGNADWGVTKFNCLTCHNIKAGGVRAAATNEFNYQSHHVQGRAVTLADCYQCHWEAKDAAGTVDAAYHSGTSGKGVSLKVWNSGSAPSGTATSATLISYTANGSRNQVAKLNNHCLGCHSSTNATAAPFVAGSRTDKYSPEQRLTGRSATDNTSILSRYSSTRTVAWSNYLFNNNSGQVAQFGTNQKNKVSKALSAHGNASKNQMPGWSAAADGPGEDKAMNDYTYTGTSGKRNVFCYDCHNSHGSNATGITSSYSSATGGLNWKTTGGKGGLLKTTVNGERGYGVTYTPAARTITYSNVSGVGQAARTTTSATFNPGAAICNDCHNNDTSKVNISRPWSITGTYSSTRAIVGYWSTPYFDNYTVYPAKRTVYKAGGTVNAINDRRKPMGGHFGSSVSTRSAGHSGNINGLCTPCHDPHGVSNLLSADRDHGVPLLKGTWVTSPYLEDKAGKLVKRGGGSKFAGIGSGGAAPGYHIDQNTFLTSASTTYVINGGANGPATSATARGNKRSQHFRSFNTLSSAKTATSYPNLADTTFAGLCMECHGKATLTTSTAGTAANWQTPGRVHQTVSGWAATTGGNANNQLHAFTCAKCHAPHVSRLPRLLVTNCLDQKHFGQQVASSINSVTGGTTTPGNIIQSTLTSSALGAGRFPGGGSRYSNTPASAQNSGGWWFQTNGNAAGSGTQPTVASYGSLCHNATNAGGSTTYSPVQQKWNKKSQW